MIGSVISEVNCNRCRPAPVDAMIYMFATIDKDQFAKTIDTLKSAHLPSLSVICWKLTMKLSPQKIEIFRRYVSLVGGLIPPLCRIS